MGPSISMSEIETKTQLAITLYLHWTDQITVHGILSWFLIDWFPGQSYKELPVSGVRITGRVTQVSFGSGRDGWDHAATGGGSREGTQIQWRPQEETQGECSTEFFIHVLAVLLLVLLPKYYYILCALTQWVTALVPRHFCIVLFVCKHLCRGLKYQKYLKYVRFYSFTMGKFWIYRLDAIEKC